MAGSVQQRPTGITLTLGDAGEVHVAQYGLAAAYAVSLQAQPAMLTLHFPADTPGGALTLTAPAGYALQKATAGVKLESKNGSYQLTVPQGCGNVVLVKK